MDENMISRKKQPENTPLPRKDGNFFSPQNIFNRHPPLQKHHGQSLTTNLAALNRIDIHKNLTKTFKALCRHLSLITPPI